MSLLLIDGFDLYSAASELFNSGKYVFYSSPGGHVATSGISRTGSQAIRCVNLDSNFGAQVASADEHATFILGCGIRVDVANTSTALCQFNSDNGATDHVTIALNSDGSITATRGARSGTVLGSSAAGAWSNAFGGVFHYLEVKVTLSDTVGTVDVHVDGVSVLSLTGKDTKNGGTKTVFDSFYLPSRSDPGTPSNLSSYYDDLYVCNGAGSTHNTFLGDVRVRTLTPNANGNSSQGVGSDGNSVNNYQLIDDVLLSGGTADYVDLQATGDTDTYGLPDLTETSGLVYGVQLTTYDAKSDAGARSIAHVVRIAGVDYVGSDYAESLGSFQYRRSLFPTSPATSALFTIAEVNAMEAGAKARA